MPRKRRDEEIVISFWKQFARDASCPWALRVYCVNLLAVKTGMVCEGGLPPIPGTYVPKKVVEPSPIVSKDAPTEVEAAAAEAVADVKNFMKQLGGADANPQT